MRKLFTLVAAAGVAAAGLAAHAASLNTPVGLAGNGVSSAVTPVATSDKLYDYCLKVMDDMNRGKTYGGKNSDGFAAADCVGLYATPAQGGQPNRGGAGGGLPGLPGGQGGKSGAAGGAGGGAASAQYDADFFAYCTNVLKQVRPGAASKKPVESDDYEPEDCIDYFASLQAGQGAGGKGGTAGRDGTSGQSIAGGQGGKGGKSGTGSGAGGGGGGGTGIAGGKGGKGGAGGSTD